MLKSVIFPAIAILLAGCSMSTLKSAVPRGKRKQTSSAAFLNEVKSWNMKSSASKRTYQISLAVPDGYSKEHSPYPILYAVDANAEFGTVVETARNLAFTKEVPDLVIVGIGYPNPGVGLKASFAPRVLDLTPSGDAAWVNQSAEEFRQVGLPVPEGSGGAPGFLKFLREELIPSIEKKYNVKPDDRALFGHSIGGLFGLYVLFEGDGLYQRFIVGSPSIWWDKRVILDKEKSFAATGRAIPARVFLSVGSLEQGDPAYPMVTDMRALTKTLKRRHYEGLEFRAHIFDDETHVSVVPATISNGLRFIYSTTAPTPPL